MAKPATSLAKVKVTFWSKTKAQNWLVFVFILHERTDALLAMPLAATITLSCTVVVGLPS